MTFIPLINEKDLLLRLRIGDEEAFEILYRNYVDAIYRKIFYLVKSCDIAEEVTQEVFLKIWEKRSSIDTEKCFRALVYCIAKNLVTDMYRKLALEKKWQDYLISAVNQFHNPIESHYDSMSDRQLLMSAIDTLPSQRKKVILLVKLEKKSYEEVSKILGISTSTIRDHVVKGTKKLKAVYSKSEVALLLVAATLITGIFINNFI